VRAAAEAAWGVPVASNYGMSEGVFTGACPYGVHLPDDLCLVEPVDAAGSPVAPGATSERIYVTNLYNHALPLIRYEVTDELTVLEGACRCGSAMGRIADPQGRLDDTFVYRDGRSVHPHVFRSVLAGHADVLEYQVAQTERGADVRVVGPPDLDAAGLERAIAARLAALGLDAPVATVAVVASLERLASGKLKRFVALRA
jgi:phenylacetate-coenzyme A ligase PaaK-like adenylate-forming protein